MGLLEDQEVPSLPAVVGSLGDDAMPESVAAYQNHAQNHGLANRHARRASRKQLSREIRMRALLDKKQALWFRAATERLGVVSSTWAPRESNQKAKRGKRR